MAKRIKIVVEDDKKGVVELTLTQKDVHNLYDMGFILHEEDSFHKILVLNKCDKTFWKLHDISAKLVDAIGDGIVYQYNQDAQKMKKVKGEKFWHSGRAPKWRKQR